MLGVLKYDLVKEGSKLFHYYADSLKSTRIKDKRINIYYKFEADVAQMEFEYKEGKIYLLDYIFERNVKTHLERVYCQKFMRPNIILDSIDVDIAVYSKNYIKKKFEIKYRLLDKGYPEINLDTNRHN